MAFTTPQLFGARLPRPRAGGPPDLILANPSGQPDISPLPGAKLLAAPGLTAHDQALWQKLRELSDFAPEKIREAMIAIAAEGWRGRAAIAWADEQKTADTTALRRMFFLLLTDLIRRTELPAEAQVPPEQESLIYLRPRIGKAVARIAKRYSMTTEAVEAAIEALASVFMPLGKRDDSVTGHTRAAMAELHSFIKEIDQWLAPGRDNARGLRAEFLLRKAKLTLMCTQAAINELDRVLDDTTILLRAWQRDQASVLRRASRPQWLLDGWDIIIALWRQSEPSDREATFWEMSHLVPELPKEVEGWAGFPEGGSSLRLESPAMIQGLDWRRSRPLEFIARNETLLTGTHAISLGSEAKKLREAYLVQSTRSLTQGSDEGGKGEDALTRISKRASRASDSVLQQVVAVLEAVPSRTMLDPIIESARPRLKLLRPPRPITFARILFLPFDGAVVPLKEWSMGSAKLPRPALMPISEAIRAAMGPEAEKISANLGGRSFFDVLQVDSEGRTLWAEAARLAPTLSFPKGLPAAGLDAAQSEQLLELAAGIWRHADAIWEAKLACFSGPSSELVAAALKGPAEEGEAVFSIALLSLLDRAQSPGSVLATAARLSPIASNIADEKLRELQAAPLPILPAEDPVRAAHIAAEYVALLKEFENLLSGRSKERQAVITPLMQSIGEAIKEVTQQIIQRQFLPALNEPNAKRRAAVVLNIEILARALGRLEEAGRRAGRFEAFDKLQVSHAVKLRSILNGLDGGGLQRHDVIRIADILLGAEKAMELAAPAYANRK
ncbi:MAG: hypothetical protein ING24_06060 [Roseomonas sp.]|nr:hypothetical protein [Roseomonas sp.]MCA3341989.1 hypothetical protein [Roseomonas sp.]